ncbi:hypothetical protein ANCDUO_12159, partial [Ancylostoma duodenale]
FVDNGRVLVLNHVQSEEEGRYTCKAENKAGKAEADTYVQVTALYLVNELNPRNAAYPNTANSSGYVSFVEQNRSI